MKWEVFVKALLTGVLVVCAISLERQLSATRARVLSERRKATETPGMVLRSTAGIDVSGRLVYETVPAGTRRVIVCGFREATLRDDVNLWNAVAVVLSSEPGVNIVGYCDTTACAEAARRLKLEPGVAVVAYGQAGASQVVLSADANGSCLVLDAEMRTLRSIAWRTEALGAVDVAKGAME